MTHRSRAIWSITTLQMGCTEGRAPMTISQTNESHLPPRDEQNLHRRSYFSAVSHVALTVEVGSDMELSWFIDGLIEYNHLGNINQLIPTIWFDLFDWFIVWWIVSIELMWFDWLSDGFFDWWVYLIWFDLIWFDWFIDCHCFTSLSLILDLSSVCL